METVTQKPEQFPGERESLLEYMVENAGDILWTYDFTLDHYTYASPSVLRLRGYTPEEVLQQKLLDPLTPASAKEAERLVRERIAALQRGDQSAKFAINEFEQLRKDGSTVMTEVMTTFVLDATGCLTGIVGIARDISKRIEDEYREKVLEKKLYETEKNASISRMAAGIAHELNNALTPVTGYSDILQTALKENPELHAYACRITESATRASVLINQLLDFSSSQQLQLQTIKLTKVLADFGHLIRSSIRENIAVVFQDDRSAPTVLIDLQKFRQVILSLLLNAQDAMPKGGTITIRTGTETLSSEKAQALGLPAQKCASITLTDTGTGIPDTIMPHIFDPFFTTNPKRPGAGLGLSTVYGIVKQFGGGIEIQSNVETGTSARIRLPLLVPEITGNQQHANTCHHEAKQEATILLAEDDDMVREMVSDILRMQGYHVIAAETGQACIAAAQAIEGKADLLLTDVIMADINGIELAETLTQRFPAIKILFMSGYDSAIINESARLPTGHHMLRKPFEIKALCSLLRTLLNGKG